MAKAELQIGKAIALTAQSVATRARLIATAERLFAERGIEGVSLSDINLAAGQKNKNATHYHFGDKRGLLQAIFDKHLPAITMRREQLLDELKVKGAYTVAGVVRALLYPLAEKLFDADGGPEFIRFNARLAASHAAVLNQSGSDIFHIGPLDRLQSAKAEFLQHLPPAIAEQRVSFAISLIFNSLADHSRMLDPRTQDAAAHTELLIRNLEDCLVAICNAPVSPVVVEVLQKSSQAVAPAVRSPRKRATIK